jgi:hypothetical protein
MPSTNTANNLIALGLPLLGSILGGPPALAIGAITLVTNALGLPSNSSAKDISNAVRQNPEDVRKLQEVEANYQAYLLSVKLQIDQAAFADSANARARELEITRATGQREWFPPALGTVVVLGFTVVLCAMVFLPPPPEGSNKRDENTNSLINILVGALTAGYSTVLGYYFGSSAGSRKKDYTIANFTPVTDDMAPLPLPAPASTPAPAPARAPLPTPVSEANLTSSAPSTLRKSWKDP